MFEKSNPISAVLSIFKNFGHSEPRVHPNRREWEAMTFYRRGEE
ncbi:hypothetical protein [uncultured Cohaesibacter sp.]|nr:hypothetical protein [uncultured Cohaesibacter sp.]